MGLRRDVAGRAIDGALADEYSSEANERWLSGNGPTTVNFHGSSDEGSTRREDGGFGRTDLAGEGYFRKRKYAVLRLVLDHP